MSTLTEELKVEILKMLKESIYLDITTKSEYTGGMDGGDLYKVYHSVTLIIDDVVVSAISF